MKLQMEKFGTVLISRPAGREAALAALAYSIPKEGDEPIELDFTSVNVLTPSWTDEFLQTLEAQIGRNRINIIEGTNPSVQMTMKTLRELA
ncbi:MAG: STAS-like domain-containing protein [Candidatus Uhrbacteria bacterium]|nr:STAS-like domain-containing protein [Candidatus Uhrbacteria bacterium]